MVSNTLAKLNKSFVASPLPHNRFVRFRRSYLSTRRISCSVEKPVAKPTAQNERKPDKAMNEKSFLLQSFRSASSRDSGSGTIWLCFMNVVLFVLGNVFNLRAIQSLYFLHASPRWWQFITSAFCHANFEHLSSNLFLLYVFGKLVEEQEGAFGVWMTYLICAIGSNLVSLWKYPANAVSLGASAAVFGLFVVSVLIRLSWNWKNILEVGILGQFVVTHIIHEVNAQLQGGTSSSMGTVGHLSHLAGALMGVLLIVLLKQLPDPDGNGKRSS